MDISVIIPIYNVEEYLKDCLDSVLKLTEKVDAEVIMIDDGSTDNSSNIAKEYAETHEAFSYHYQENGGLGNARNNGVKLAQGKYIVFVDSDDLIEANVWERMLSAAEKNKSELTICDAVRIADKKISSAAPFLFAFHNFIETKTHITKRPELVYDTTAWDKLILRSFYLERKMEFPEGVLYEDISWAIPLHYYANEVSVVNEIGYYWRTRTGNNLSITQKKDERKNLVDKLNAFQRAFDFLDNVVKNPQIRTMMEIRQWGFDYTGHLKAIESMQKEDGMEYITLLAEFMKKNMTKAGVDSIPLIHQQIVNDVLAQDMEHLKRVLNYNKINYQNAPIVDGKLLASNEIFTIQNRSADNEFRWKPARCMVDDGVSQENKMLLECHVYYRKMNMPEGTQSVSAYLWDPLCGHKVALKTALCSSKWLTKEQGTVINYDDYRTYQYDYDGAGFIVVLDFEELDKQDIKNGRYKIVVEYENDTVSGKRILGGVKKGSCPFLKGFSYKGEKKEITISQDKKEVLQFTISDMIYEEIPVEEVPVEEIQDKKSWKNFLKLKRG